MCSAKYFNQTGEKNLNVKSSTQFKCGFLERSSNQAMILKGISYIYTVYEHSVCSDKMQSTSF